jgi:hypothetical protein
MLQLKQIYKAFALDCSKLVTVHHVFIRALYHVALQHNPEQTWMDPVVVSTFSLLVCA